MTNKETKKPYIIIQEETDPITGEEGFGISLSGSMSDLIQMLTGLFAMVDQKTPIEPIIDQCIELMSLGELQDIKPN